MSCTHRERLFSEYFDTLAEQCRIRQQLAAVYASGNAEITRIAKRQFEIAVDECYDAWRSLNDHRHSDSCAA